MMKKYGDVEDKKALPARNIKTDATVTDITNGVSLG